MNPVAVAEPRGRLPLFLRELKGALYTGLLGLKISVLDFVAELLSLANSLSFTCVTVAVRVSNNLLRLCAKSFSEEEADLAEV